MLKQRVVKGMWSNGFGMAITILTQVATLPIFLHYWDLETYGIWLILSAIPSYLLMADLGILSAVGNNMTITYAKGNIEETNVIFQSAFAFMLVLCISFAIITSLLVMYLPLENIEATTEQRLTVLVLSFTVLIAFFNGLAESIYRATNRYPQGAFLGNSIRLLEWIGGILGLVLFQSLFYVAVFKMTFRLIGTLYVIFLSTKGGFGIFWKIQKANKKHIKEMLKPAFSFMIIPMTNALSFQGVTIILGIVLGPASLAIFNTYRTISRITVQVTTMFSNSIWPEFSRLYGEKSFGKLKRIYRNSCFITLIQAILMSIFVYFISPWMLAVWTHNEINFIPSLMLILAIYASISSSWHVPRVLLLSTNSHFNFTILLLFSAVLTVALAWIFGNSTHEIDSFALAMLISEIFIGITTFLLARQFIEHKLNE